MRDVLSSSMIWTITCSLSSSQLFCRWWRAPSPPPSHLWLFPALGFVHSFSTLVSSTLLPALIWYENSPWPKSIHCPMPTPVTHWQYWCWDLTLVVHDSFSTLADDLTLETLASSNDFWSLVKILWLKPGQNFKAQLWSKVVRNFGQNFKAEV